MSTSHRSNTIQEHFDRDRRDCEEAIESLKLLCESRYYEGWTACTVAVIKLLEDEIPRPDLAEQLCSWLLEAHQHATMQVSQADQDEIGRQLRRARARRSSRPGSN